MPTFSKSSHAAALLRLGWLTAILFLLGGCATGLGPRVLGTDRLDYQEQIVRTSDEQMLLNLVRLRYRDNPLFLEVGSIVTSYQLGATLNLTGMFVPAASPTTLLQDQGIFGIGGNFVELPTLTYTPLQGEAYAARLMSPVPLRFLMYFYQTGWNIERVLLVAVREVNEVYNAPTASSPTPETSPDYEKFADLAARLRRLQLAGLAGIAVEDAGNARMWLRMSPDPESSLATDVRMVRQILQLAPEKDEFRLSDAPYKHDPDEVGLRSQSLMSILYFLSQAVEPPAEHGVTGMVTITKDKNGQPFDWSRVLGKVLRIQSQKERPSDPSVAVRYRDWWFYIADNDLSSKSTFSLLNYLFALQSAPGEGKSPALTLPVGGGR